MNSVCHLRRCSANERSTKLRRKMSKKIKLLIVESAMEHLLCFATIKAWNWLLAQRLERRHSVRLRHAKTLQRLWNSTKIPVWVRIRNNAKGMKGARQRRRRISTVRSIRCRAWASRVFKWTARVRFNTQTHIRGRDRSPKNNYTETKQANFRLWKHRKWVQHNAQTDYWNSSCLDFAERASHFALRSNKNVQVTLLSCVLVFLLIFAYVDRFSQFLTIEIASVFFLVRPLSLLCSAVFMCATNEKIFDWNSVKAANIADKAKKHSETE